MIGESSIELGATYKDSSAALAVFQTTPQPRVSAGFLTGRRG